MISWNKWKKYWNEISFSIFVLKKRKKIIWVELSRNTNYADRAGNPNESEYDFAIHMSIMALHGPGEIEHL